MTKLSLKKRDDAKVLLEDHQKVCDALTHVSKATWVSSIFVTHQDGNDDVSVDLHHELAKSALTEQKQWIEAELAKLGIEVGG